MWSKLASIERLNLTMSAGAVAASFAVATPHFALSLATGAALEAVNLGALHRYSRLLFSGELPGAGPWVGSFGIRFLLLAIGIVVALSAGANPAGLLVGLSVAVPAAVIDAWRNRPPYVDPATLPVTAPDDPAWDRWSVWRVRELEVDEMSEEWQEAHAERMASGPLASESHANEGPDR